MDEHGMSGSEQFPMETSSECYCKVFTTDFCEIR